MTWTASSVRRVGVQGVGIGRVGIIVEQPQRLGPVLQASASIEERPAHPSTSPPDAEVRAAALQALRGLGRPGQAARFGDVLELGLERLTLGPSGHEQVAAGRVEDDEPDERSSAAQRRREILEPAQR